MQQQDPIVVELSEQPDPTPEISYGSVLASAVNLVGLILAVALVVGVLVGGVIIWRRKRAVLNKPVDEPSHVRLRI